MRARKVAAEHARYCGRTFSAADLKHIRQLITENPTASRAQLSRLVCVKLGWMRENGRPKEMSCRVAMLRMQDDGVLQLPPPRNGNHNGKPYLRRTTQAEPGRPIRADTPRTLGTIQLHLISSRTESHLHNEYIDRYHYLGYQPLPGAQLRYFVRANDQIVALLSFGAAAWKTQPRDHYIGWSPAQRQQYLHHVVNNARFLILPWVECKNLASTILARAIQQITSDWLHQYGYRPLLLETFVEHPRFRGTAYKAANWICLGQTTGRGKLDVYHQALLPIKTVWVYPLVRNFRHILCR